MAKRSAITITKRFPCAKLWAAFAALCAPAVASAQTEELPDYVEPGPGGVYVESIGPGISLEPIPSALTDDLALHCDEPAVTESSGTWLRRGLWYADLEAVVMSRTWDTDGVVFAAEFIGLDNFNGPEFDRSTIGESSPGAEGSARFTLGRFLFRDDRNRDHNAEMVVMGGGEWNEEFQIQPGETANFLVPVQMTNFGDFLSFSNASEMDLIYSSRLTSFEWNYSVTDRLRKDRMELMPSGQWVRRASSGLTQEFLAGLRFIDLEENVVWGATGIVNTDLINGEGDMTTRTRNNLFGVQLGYGLSYESDRWNVSLNTKQAFLVNDGRSTRNLSIVADNTSTGFSHDNHENKLSYLIQVSLISRYHVRPNLSLRFGWEMTYLTNVALAPNELTFNPSVTPLGLTGDPVYHGFTAGTEYYW